MDYCGTCGHPWHGLTCQVSKYANTDLEGVVEVVCLCPSQWMDTPVDTSSDQ